MNWFSPRTVRGWFVLIVLGALLLSQVISLGLLASQQTILQSAIQEAEALNRTEGLVKLARNANEQTLQNILLTASSPSFIVSFDTQPSVAPNRSNPSLARDFAERIDTSADHVRVAWDETRALALTTVVRHAEGERTIIITRASRDVPAVLMHPLSPLPPVPPVPPAPPAPPAPPVVSAGPHDPSEIVQNIEVSGPEGLMETQDIRPLPRRLDISIQLRPDRWLNVLAVPAQAPTNLWPLLFAGLSAAILLAIAAIWAAGRVARPIAGLTDAANRLGRGDVLVLAPEEGPADVKGAARAFNQMAARLRRLIDDQRTLLSAVGHDLRTPIASLRIRTELVKDQELQARMLSSLEEMQRLTEAALAAARGGESGEATRAVDLPSLVEAVCDDLADTGEPVTFSDLKPVRVDGKASELRRALRNLIENAIRYGTKAMVSMQVRGRTVDLVVEDEGPGIPEQSIDQVTKPFVRLEESRNTETGGHGLGLTITRAIAERHGGKLVLQNRPEGGLRATLRLPIT